MEEERTRYASSILTSKKPFEVAEITRIRLSQAKLINNNFYVLFKEVSELKKNYVQQLRKIIVINEDLDKLMYDDILQNNVLTEAEMAQMEFDWLGSLRPVWAQVIRGLKADMQSKMEEYRTMDREITSSVKNMTELNGGWTELKQLHSQLSKVAAEIEASKDSAESPTAANTQWSERAPYLMEKFEAADVERLSTLKNHLLKYQNLINDSLHANLDETEKIIAALLHFNPDNEIERFASAVMEYEFQFESPTSARAAGSSSKYVRKNAASSGNAQESNYRKPSSATVIKNSLLTDDFSNSKNNASLSHKRASKLKSKVGSIFSRRKEKKVSSIQVEAIAESETSSVNSHRPPSSSESELYGKSRFIANQQVSGGAPASLPVADTETSESKTDLVPNKTPFSITQEPLKPQPKTRSFSEQQNPSFAVSNTSEDGNAIVSNPFPVISVDDSPSGKSVDTQITPKNHFVQPSASSSSPASYAHPPQPPQSRKPHPSTNLGSHGIPSSSPSHLQIQAPVIPEYSGNRRDIHSTLFYNLTKADIDLAGTQQIPLSSQITGELKPLDPQITGSSLNMNVSHMSGQSLFQHTELTTFGLNASIGEVVNAKFQDGILVSSQLIGEIALNYISPDYSFENLPLDINLKIESEEPFDKLIVNHAFLERTMDNSDVIFKINPQFILGKTLGALKYSLKSPFVPIVIHPVWRFEDTQASVMLTLKIFSSLPDNIKEVTLDDLVVSVAIDNATVTTALSKPQGSFSKEKKRITWRFKEPVVLNRESEQRLIARFLTDKIAQESSKGVQAKFNIRGFQLTGLVLKSRELSLDDPFGSEAGEWNDVAASRTLVAGSYYGLSI
ncbi:Syp1p Ecym_8127 [Eremothecium cymbalariae DBVPG|uniref:MHD domain-containing protein n=1 Tax=Eremothecium cymbalariae (strain CBS 270.75 / DBVPG 7215 / KCTC 17166 / NRRL Y-17582) TaxID=931890 RepID=G8JX44_ERECY|nr:Hypothetical protein Ecym_8127 [Eremothecium cymbalariae DBVPG\